MTQSETIDYLKRAIEHAPQDPGKLAENLIGWTMSENVFICAKCAGRIMSRGCRLPDAEPVWNDASGNFECCTCEPKPKVESQTASVQSNHPPITILEQLTANLDENEKLQIQRIGSDLVITRVRAFFIPGSCVCQYAEKEHKISLMGIRTAVNPECALASAIQQTAIDVRAKEFEINDAAAESIRHHSRIT